MDASTQNALFKDPSIEVTPIQIRYADSTIMLDKVFSARMKKNSDWDSHWKPAFKRLMAMFFFLDAAIKLGERTDKHYILWIIVMVIGGCSLLVSAKNDAADRTYSIVLSGDFGTEVLLQKGGHSLNYVKKVLLAISQALEMRKQ